MAIVDPRQSAERATLIRNQLKATRRRDRHFRQDHLRTPEQEIIYREFRERIGRLASGLCEAKAELGSPKLSEESTALARLIPTPIHIPNSCSFGASRSRP
jgi:hypothetical protein